MGKAFNRTIGASGTEAKAVNLICPSCNQNGTFERVANNVTDARIRMRDTDAPDHREVIFDIGLRAYPNTDCNAVVYVAKETNSPSPLDSYPKTRIEFDVTNVPENIVTTFQEALICTSEECYVAAAIMIRRTLEELCEDKGAAGDNLKQRLEDFGNQIILPKQLLKAANYLRLLGNDAAHIEDRTYDKIGKEEILTAIKLTKELIKASYQYETLLDELKSNMSTS